MAKDRADLAGYIEPRDWFPVRIENPLEGIVCRPPLSVGDNGPCLHGVKGWFAERHHGPRRTAEVRIFSAGTVAVPEIDSGL